MGFKKLSSTRARDPSMTAHDSDGSGTASSSSVTSVRENQVPPQEKQNQYHSKTGSWVRRLMLLLCCCASFPLQPIWEFTAFSENLVRAPFKKNKKKGWPDRSSRGIASGAYNRDGGRYWSCTLVHTPIICIYSRPRLLHN